MPLIDLLMPQMGESIREGTILRWLKSPGDAIAEDESVLEVATDKVDTEIPTPQAGTLKEVLVGEGSVVEVGTVIARIEVQVSATKGKSLENQAAASSPAPSTNAPHPAQKVSTDASGNGEPIAHPVAQTEPKKRRFYSPLVRRIAKTEKLSISVLDSLTGTGLNGRLTKQDLLRYLKEGPIESSAYKKASLPTIVAEPADECIEMDRMRRLIADRMLASKQIAPHVTSFAEADLTRLVAWRTKHKQSFYEQEKEALTLTPLFLEAVIQTLKDYPMVNASVRGTQIIKRKAIHIGLAVALADHNLIVPVIKNADRLSLRGLAQQVNDLSKRARAGALKPKELEGGTYTVSNIGSIGSLMGTPIIVQPQVGILALGAIKKRPVVITDPKVGDMIAIRHMMYLSHSYDHRIIDGALGGAFVQQVAQYLTDFDDTRKL